MRSQFHETVTIPGSGGALIPVQGVGATPFVVDRNGAESATQASAYADRTSSTAGVMTSDANGNISFWLNSGDYNIHIADQQTPARITAYVRGFSVVTWADMQGSVGGTYSATVGNGSSTNFEIAHNLNTQDVVVEVRQAAAPYSIVDADVQITDANNVTVFFANAPAPNSYRVTVMAGLAIVP